MAWTTIHNNKSCEQSYLVQADAFQLNAAIGSTSASSLYREQAVGAVPGFLTVA